MPSIETIARCVIIRENAVLICGALRHDEVQYWYLPGGHVEPGETARHAVTREMIEEAGVRVDVGECALVSENHFTQVKKSGSSARRHEYTLVFRASTPTVEIESREADLRFAWMPLANIGTLDLRPESHRLWLVRHCEMLVTGRTPPLEFHVEQS